MPEFDVKDINGELIKTVQLPKHLPARVGDKAQRLLGVEMTANPEDSEEGKVKGEIKITSEKFSEVAQYLYQTMLDKFGGKDSWDWDVVNNDSAMQVSEYYFDQLNVFGSKKK